MRTHDFAQLLFGGPCNLRCPDCIGRRLRPEVPDTLAAWPPPGLGRLLAAVRAGGLRELSLSGVNTDPLLYRPLGRLLRLLRRALPGVRVSLHTNGRLLLARREELGGLDRLSVSIPSLRPETCLRMTGSAEVPDLADVQRRLGLPLKVSVLLSPHNRQELPELLAHVRAAGVRRVALRQRLGAPDPYDPLPGLRPAGWFAGNPVYELGGLEVSVWNFARTTLSALSLLPDGRLEDGYLLPGLRSAA
jgi:MoaA/NifB/PqqE/SkfB family radical SAM enzyme